VRAVTQFLQVVLARCFQHANLEGRERKFRATWGSRKLREGGFQNRKR
jgi:hypothetical protein